MKSKECRCATVGLAISRDERSRNCEMRPGKCRSVWRIAHLVLHGLPMVGIISLLLVPLHGRAQEDLKRHFDERDEEQRGVHREIANLESKIETLEATVSSLRGKVSSLETQLTVIRSNPALSLGPFVSVDPNPQIGVIDRTSHSAARTFISSVGRRRLTIMATQPDWAT
jgi:hypothetical protein